MLAAYQQVNPPAPGTRLIVHAEPANPLTSAPPVHPQVEIVERKERLTIQQIRKMGASEYAQKMQNPSFRAEVEALFA